MGTVVSFPRMPHIPEHRRGPDRRRQPRGGRRATDRHGYAPLVLVVDDDADSGSRSEAILSKLRFAVAPARNIDEALRIMAAIRPDLVVTREAGAERLRAAAQVAVVVTPDGDIAAEALVEEIRRALRARKRE